MRDLTVDGCGGGGCRELRDSGAVLRRGRCGFRGLRGCPPSRCFDLHRSSHQTRNTTATSDRTDERILPNTIQPSSSFFSCLISSPEHTLVNNHIAIFNAISSNRESGNTSAGSEPSREASRGAQGELHNACAAPAPGSGSASRAPHACRFDCTRTAGHETWREMFVGSRRSSCGSRSTPAVTRVGWNRVRIQRVWGSGGLWRHC
jgi:hypothetical protein